MPRMRGDRQTQVLWEDLRPWVEQLWEDHHARVEVHVTLVPEDWKLNQAIELEVFRSGVGKERKVIWSDWKQLSLTTHGGAEALALQLISKALLELEIEQERAQRQMPLL